VVCAIGMSAGMAILVASFETSVRNWVNQALQSDVYLYSAGSRSAAAASPIAPATWRSIAAHPGVREAWVLSTYVLQLGPGQPTLLTGTDMAKIREHSSLPWVEPPEGSEVFDAGRNEGLALVSESFAERFGLHRGDRLELPIPSGPRKLSIAGVFSDYGNERGSVLVDRSHLVQWMGDDSATHLSLFAAPGANPDALRAELRSEYPGLEIFTNRSLRGEILKVFRQTFSITYALEVIGIVVAITGVALTMSSVLLDRREELTTLRALGFSRPEIALAASVEGLAVALWAVMWGLLLSLGLGWLLVHVINKQSFGWTLGFSLPGFQLLALGVAVTCAGGVVSYAVGLWGAQLPADREE
jgi:putative ABC transport system permease protein